MADEPRRSGRSTKGQHKNLDMITEPHARKSKAKAQSKEKPPKASAEPTPAPSEEEEIIRCICGEYEEEEDIERDMICCDKCSAWQHNDCMGLTFAKGEEPDEYFCEICKPENHTVLLAKIARGEKPWEEAAEKRRQELEKKAPRRRKGKRGGRKSRASEVKSEPPPPPPVATVAPSVTATPTPAPPPAPTPPVKTPTPVREEKNRRVSESRPPSTQKRKFSQDQESAQPEAGPKTKQQKVSPQVKQVTAQDAKVPSVKADSNAPPPRQGPVAEKATPDAVGTPEEIKNSARKSAATALVKLFVDQISEAQKQGSFNLPDAKSAEEVARHLGVSIENAMYQNLCGGSAEPTEAYKQQLRTILFNVKKNPSLRDRLLVGNLSADALSKMSSQDMAPEELQQKDAEIKREAERQHIIVQEQGPRIRRTHKGEELVEDDNHNVATESVFSAVPARRSVIEADGSPSGQSPVSPKGQHQPQFTESKGPAKPQLMDTKVASGNAHDQHFYPGVQSPGGIHDSVFPEVATHIQEPVPHGKVQADAEIDKLLRDVEPDSPPYSPKDFSDESIVWRGKVVMNPIAEFSASAKHVGGADLSGRIPWSQLAPSTLLVDGRIDIQLASNYLCGLRFSSSTDVTVISISSPDSPSQRAGFDKLFNYFAERNRYGVIGKHPVPAVKDTYIIPVEAGSTKKPEFIELLENNALEDPNRERLLLIVFVVKTSESNPSSVQPPSHNPSQEPATDGSPLTGTASTPQQMHFSTPGPRPVPQAAPTPAAPTATSTPAHAAYAGPNGQQPSHPAGNHEEYQPSEPHQTGLTGIAAAIQVLGPEANAPAIQQLLHNAPNADVFQLNIIREILQRQPEAAANYQLLTQALFEATTNGHQQNATR